jgi:menaquinone-dependent protoporphyrinogen IX oxidase
MRVAIVYLAPKNREKLESLSKAIAKGLEGGGHSSTIVNALLDTDIRLSSYDFVFFGTEAVSLFTGRVSPKINDFLKKAGQVTGKRSFAFIAKPAFSEQRALQRLMNRMEDEGLKVIDFESFKNPAEAQAFISGYSLER